MHPNVQRVQRALDAFGAARPVVELSESTRTSAEAARAIGTTVERIAKSIVFSTADDGVLVIASGTNRVSEAKLTGLLGEPVQRADANGVRKLTGYPIGGVPPIAHSTTMKVLIDEDLLRHEEIWAAAGTPNAVFPTTPEELVRLSGGRVADVKQE